MLDLLAFAGPAPGYGPLADPPGTSVLVAAVAWLEATLLGTVATVAAALAIAWFGAMMLAGRIDLRAALAAIAGSFILFGAATIAAGLRASLAAPAPAAILDAPPPPPAPPPQPAPAPQPAAVRDPYAGASVPEG